MKAPIDEWNADFLDLADSFLTAKVDFLIVGAFALQRSRRRGMDRPHEAVSAARELRTE